MYEAFYGLHERPFNLTPDPRYLFLSDKHKEAFAHLLYGIKNRCGFVMVSGEIGTGKTTICRTLLNQLDDDIEVAFIFNPCLSAVDLLRKINDEFGIDSGAETIKGLIDALNAYLLERNELGRNCVLVIDEAQSLNPEVLEQIRLLSNLETETQKLLQIVLIGQPELGAMLDLPELRQLNQRITARYHLKALDKQETLQYVAYRLRVAGGRKKVRFTRAAVRAVHRYSQGTPRVINALCDRTLLIGYTQELHEITKKVVRRAAKEVQGEKLKAPTRRQSAFRLPKRSLAAATLVLAMVAGIYYAPPSVVDSVKQWPWLTRATEVIRDGGPAFFREIARAATDESNAVQSTSSRVNASEPTGSADKQQPIDVARNTPRRALPIPMDASSKEAGAKEQAAGAPPPDVEAPEHGLAPLLAGLTPENTRHAAAQQVLRAWQMAMLGPYPDGDSPESLGRFAEENELAHEVLNARLEELAVIDLPAFIEVTAHVQDGGGNGRDAYWLGLLGLDERDAWITTAPGKTVQVSREILQTACTGRAVVLWQASEVDEDVLTAGTTGEAVTALQADLVELGILEGPPSGVYDRLTREVVTRLQRAAGIQVVGRTGRQTRMVLASWLNEGDTPSLHRSDGEPPVTRIARTIQAEARNAVASRGQAQANSEPDSGEISPAEPEASSNVTAKSAPEASEASEASDGSEDGVVSSLPSAAQSASWPENTAAAALGETPSLGFTPGTDNATSAGFGSEAQTGSASDAQGENAGIAMPDISVRDLDELDTGVSPPSVPEQSQRTAPAEPDLDAASTWADGVWRAPNIELDASDRPAGPWKLEDSGSNEATEDAQ